MDLTVLSSLIKGLLIDTDRVALPGLGVFYVETTSAQFSENGDSILPPKKSIIFKGANVTNDGLIEFAYSKDSGKSIEESRKDLLYLLDRVRKDIEDGIPVVMPEFGQIIAKKEYVFTLAEDNQAECVSSYCLSEIELEKSPNQDANEVVVASQFEEKEENIEEEVTVNQLKASDEEEKDTIVSNIINNPDKEELESIEEQRNSDEEQNIDNISDNKQVDAENTEDKGQAEVAELIEEVEDVEKVEEVAEEVSKEDQEEIVTEDNIIEEVKDEVEHIEETILEETPIDKIEEEVKDNEQENKLGILDNENESNEQPINKEEAIQENKNKSGNKVVVGLVIFIVILLILAVLFFIFREEIMRFFVDNVLYSSEELEVINNIKGI